MKKPRFGGAFLSADWRPVQYGGCSRSGTHAVVTDPAHRSVMVVRRLARQCRASRVYSPSVSSEALPPAAVVLMVMVFSVVKRGR